MRKILCILVILALSIPAVSVANGCKAKPVEPIDPGTLPNIDPQLIDAAMARLAAAIAAKDYDAIGQALAAAEEQLATALRAGGIGDVKAQVRVDAEHERAVALLKVRAKGQSYNGIALGCLAIKAKVKHTSDGLYRVNVRINGRFTDAQEAYILALFQKYQGQMPGVVFDLKIC